MVDSLFNSSFTLPLPNPDIPPEVVCPGTVPLVLLPVRLETRFFTLPGNVTELRVRIYPDRIHIDTHHPELTTEERTLGTQYWEQDWRAGNDRGARAEAWRSLANRFRAERAAWIARVLRPTNIRQRPATPVPVDQSPEFPPVFPTLPPVGVNGESAWRRAPLARLLPDRWTAVVHFAGRVALTVSGNPIVQPVAVGPDPAAPALDPQTEAAVRAGEQLPLDSGMQWMVDFDAAEAKGMALRITIPPEMLTPGIDSLLVFGVASSISPTESTRRLADLLDAHHYTDGLEFLRFGAPTNNTDDQRAAFNSEDADHERSFAHEVEADPTQAANALRVGNALGIPTARIAPTLGRIGQATQDYDLDMRSMNAALWPVSWGYFLSNMVGAETGLTPAAVDWARGHFLSHVRSGGPFPPLRCGAQPYGLLPVTSLEPWAPDADSANAIRELALKTLLLRMRERLWRPVVARAARIGMSNPPDPDADLAEVMKIDGISYGFNTRAALGRHYVEHLYALDAEDFSGVSQAQNEVTSALLRLLDLPPELVPPPHLSRVFLSTVKEDFIAPLVQSGEVSPWRKLEPNYIEAFLSAPTIQALIDARPDPQAKDHLPSLLQTLLRHAMLRELATAAARIAATIPGKDLATLWRDLELIDLVDAAPVDFTLQPPPQSLHWKRQLDLHANGIPANLTIRQYLESLTSFTDLKVASLGEFRASLAHLKDLDSESLQLLMLGALDLSTHRLDAWITSFATNRLASMAASETAGRFIGGYGWVENLRPATPPPTIPEASRPPGEQAPLYALSKDSGFIHAPSLTHAATAAILRNAHLGPTGIPAPDGPFAIDLSSRRVREALHLLEGVRQGQPLGALLGYRLERRLHDLQLDRFIVPLRTIAPLVVREREAIAPPTEALAANNVVDALVLLRRWQSSDPALIAALQSALATAAERALVTGELEALRDSVDGLSDALSAETAYQMVRGNTSRMAGTLSAIARGESLPPDLEVAQMPRTGTSLTHRVAVLFSGLSNSGAGWLAGNATPRPLSERWLNAWARQLMGDARRIRCTVERVDDATGAVIETHVFPLANVPVTVLDFIYFVGSSAESSQSNASPCYAEQLVLYHARRAADQSAQATLRLQHERPSDLASNETTLFDVLEQARALRRVLESARGLLPDDISPPERGSQATLDITDLEARVARLENSLNTFNKRLTALIANGTETSAEELRVALLNLGLLGFSQTIPCVAVGDDPATRAALIRQSVAVLKESEPRLVKCLALRALPAAEDPRERTKQLIARGLQACGQELVMLPYFTCDAAASAELANALSASTTQQGGDLLSVNSWFTRAARVRDNLARLGASLRIADVLATGSRLNLTIAQLPFDSTERWVGLPPVAGTELPPGKLSLAVQSMTPINTRLRLSGLLIDEWVEVVPSKSETTALTFQFDPPNSFAPQNVLIAVPPVPGQDWTTESLRSVLMETLDLAKLRAVDIGLLGAAAQFLPALHVPFNNADDAVSTHFAPLTA